MRVDVVEKLVEEGMTATSVVTIPLRYNTGVTEILTDGADDKAYVNTYND